MMFLEIFAVWLAISVGITVTAFIQGWKLEFLE